MMLRGNKPTPAMALDQRFKDEHAALNVLKPGRILAYDTVNQMATVLPLFAFMPPGGGAVVPYPVLTGVRVLHPGTDTAYIRFPIRSDALNGDGNGTEVALLFADGALDRYYEMAQGQSPVDTQDVRAHALADAVAILGLRPDRLVIMPGNGGPNDLEMAVANKDGSPIASVVVSPSGQITFIAGTVYAKAGNLVRLDSGGEIKILANGDIDIDAGGNKVTVNGGSIDLGASATAGNVMSPEGQTTATLAQQIAQAVVSGAYTALKGASPPVDISATQAVWQAALATAIEAVLLVSTKVLTE